MPTGLVPHTPPRRLVLLSVLAAALGVAGGAAAYVLVHLIALLTNLTLLHRFGWKLPSFAHHHPGPSVILAFELLLFEFSTRAFVPLVVAASVAGGMHSALFGSGPLFAVPAHHYAGLTRLPLFAVLGLLAGLFAVVVVRGLFLVEEGFRRLPVGEFWHPVIGALGFALVGIA